MRRIDADALNDAMYHEAFETDSEMQKWDSGCWIRYKMFENAIDEAPTIEPKRGEWIDEADKYDASFGIHAYRCSNCNSYADEYIGGHEWYTAGKPNFCPYCGADMRERKESE